METNWHTLKLLLKRPIVFYRHFYLLTDDLAAALFLSQACYWTDVKEGDDGWFYKSAEEWQEETCLSWYLQKKSRTTLLNLGVLEESNHKSEHKIYFRVNYEELFTRIGGLKTALEGGSLKDLDCQSKGFGEAVQRIEIRIKEAESTTESTQESMQSIGNSNKQSKEGEISEVVEILDREKSYKDFCGRFRRAFKSWGGLKQRFQQCQCAYFALLDEYSPEQVEAAIPAFVAERKNGRKPKDDNFAGPDFLRDCADYIADSDSGEAAEPEPNFKASIEIDLNRKRRAVAPEETQSFRNLLTSIRTQKAEKSPLDALD